MTKHRPSRALRLAAAMAGSALALAACGGGGGGGGGGDSASQGVTPQSIKVGTHMPLTGVAAPGYSEIPTGTKAYFDYVNSKGGVNGRKIEYIVRDDAYNPTNTSQIVNQLVLQDKVFGVLSGLGTPTHSAVIDFLNEQEVPDLFVSSGALAWNQPEKYPFTFGWQPNYEVEGKIIGKYVKEKFPQAKVGLFLQGDDFGRDGAKGAKQFLGDQIVAEETYTPGNTDVGPQISNLQKSGADLVIGFNVPSYTALSQLTALKLGYKPQWFYSNVGSDQALVGSLLSRFSEGKVKGADLLNKVYTTKYLPTVDQTDDPWIQKFSEIWKSNGNGEPLTNFRVYGMSQAYTFVQALQAAGQDVTREGLVKAIEEKGSTFGGPPLAPFDYSNDSHRGISGVSVVQLENGKTNPLTPVQTTSSGDTPIETYDKPADQPTGDGLPTVG